MPIIDPVKLSQKLIKCKSVTPADDGALDTLESALMALDFECTRLPFQEEGTEKVDNLYARLGTKSPNLCFAGHTDVVPIGDESAWAVEPFAAEIIDTEQNPLDFLPPASENSDLNKHLVGRGAVDMKPAIAAWISAISEFKKEHSDFNGSISLLITGDEEAEAINGTIKVLQWLEEKGEKLDACIVGEPTNPNELGEMVKIGRRGSLSFTLTVNGIQGHVAYPDKADNPVTKIIKMLHNLNSHHLDKGSDFFPPSNLEVTSIDVGNTATNVIPAKASAMFNVRFNDKFTREKLIKLVRAQCDQVSTQYILEHEGGSESFLTEPGFLSQSVSEAVKYVTNKTPELSTTGGTSDARFIKDYCPVVEFGLINTTAHHVNENIRVNDIIKLKDIYKNTISRYFKVK